MDLDPRVAPAGPYVQFEEIAGGLGFPEGPVALPDGSVLVVEIAAGCLSRIDARGRRSVVAQTGGGPNGAAIGPDGAVYLCNNGGSVWERDAGVLRATTQAADYAGGRIERVDLRTGRVDVLYTACDGRRLTAPNDLVFDRHGGFYFTDYGKRRAHDMDRGAVYYAQPDGRSIRPVIAPISFPNGVGLSPDGATLYVAETETARLWSFAILAPGEVERLPFPSPHGGRFVQGSASYQRFDSLKVEADGRICVATLDRGGISSITPDGAQVDFACLPDRLTTNLCFAGPELRSLVATLSSTGRLVRLRWPRPGLPLNFSDRAPC